MKTIKYISLYILLIASVVSCTKDDEMVVYNPENTTSSVLSAINSQYVLEEEKENEVMAKFTWTASGFGFNAAVEYVLEADLSGQEFKNLVEVFAVKKALANEVTQGMMNTAMLNLQKTYGFEDGTTQSVEFRIKASISNSATPLYSNTINSSITPYEGGSETMYMIGSQFGDWNWDGDVVEMIPVYEAPGDFWCIRYFDSSKGFKWAPGKEWKNDFNALGTYEGFRVDGGNAFVDTDGMYIVYISTKRDRMVIEPAQIYGIGEAFGGWDDGYPFTINGDEATITVANTNEIRMYANCSIAQGGWWAREFIIFDGKIVYRGDGEDQERVTVEAGKTVTLNFNEGTGTIQ